MKPVLTIAIPTYNRADKLKLSVLAVLKEIESYPVELLVSDNASTDDTESMMNKIIIEHNEINYTRNRENVGPDRNFLNCYNKANGEYVLLIGDDDFILPGAIKSIMEGLQEKPVFMYLNSSGVTSMKPLQHTKPWTEERGIVKYNDRTEFFKEVGIKITFVSSLIMKTSYVREVQNKEQYIGSHFLQSHLALKTMKYDGLYIINSKNCIAASPNETVRYDLYDVWGASYKSVLFDTGISCGIDRETIEKVYKNDLKNMIMRFVIKYRQTCDNEKNWDKSKILMCTKDYPMIHFDYICLVCSPSNLKKEIAFIIRAKNKILKILKLY